VISCRADEGSDVRLAGAALLSEIWSGRTNVTGRFELRVKGMTKSFSS